jgi:hypothetical protein
MITAVEPEFLPNSYARLLRNVRVDSLAIKARNGYGIALTAQIDAAAEFRGAMTASVGGGQWIFAAFRIAGTTRCYAWSGAVWIEMTTAATRFTQDGMVGFEVCQVNRGPLQTLFAVQDVVVMGNGFDAPRIFQFGSPNVIAVHDDPGVPTTVTQRPVPFAEFDCTSTYARDLDESDATTFSIPSITSTGFIDVDAFSTGSSASATAVLTFDAAYLHTSSSGVPGVVGATIQNEIGFVTQGNKLYDVLTKVEALALATGELGKAVTNVVDNGSGAPRVTVAGHGYSTNDYVRVEGVTGATGANGVRKVTVIDPNTFDLQGAAFGGSYVAFGTAYRLAFYDAWARASDSAPTVVPSNVGGSSQHFSAFYPCLELRGLTQWSGLRVTVEKPVATFGDVIVSVFTTGQVDSQSLYAVAAGLDAAYSEGSAVAATRFTRAFRSPAAQAYAYAPPSGTSTAFWVQSDLAATSVRGSLYFYRSDPEESNGVTALGPFYHLGVNGSFALPGSLPAGALNLKTDNTLGSDRSLVRLAYDETHQVIPKGGVFLNVNNRLYVAGIKGIAGGQSQLWVSGDTDLFDFSRVVRSDAFGTLLVTSPTFRTFGGEQVKAMVRLQSDIYGVDAVFLLTDRSGYRLGGFNALQITQAAQVVTKGIGSVSSIATFDNVIYWLDSEGQMRVQSYGAASRSVSYQVVDDLLRAGNITNACGYAAHQRYQLFYREEAGAGANNRGLLYDVDTQGFVQDAFNIDIRAVLPYDVSPRRQMVAITQTGAVYEWDKPGTATDAGENIACRLESRILAAPFTTARLGRAGAVFQPHASGFMTFTRAFRADGLPDQTGAGVTGQVGLNVAASPGWRYDQTGTGGIPGAAGYGPSLNVEYTVPGGHVLYAVTVDIEGGQSGARSG